MATTAREIAIRLPKPHLKQNQFRHSLAKRKVVCAGRRGGKTTGMAILAIEAMLAGRRVLEAAPTADQTDAFWHTCSIALAEPIAAGLVRKNETLRILELPHTPLAVNAPANPNLLETLKVDVMPRSPRIRCKTAHDADSLRGDYADLLILDEYSLMKPNAWAEVGAPMLLDNNGDAVFIFTPKMMNHAHTIYGKAEADTSGRWEAFHFTSFDNPHLSQDALEEITADLTTQMYQQEILAEFLQGEGAVFRNITANLYTGTETPARHKDHSLVAGVDWGQVNDFTVISIGCETCKKEVYLDRFNQIDWHFQRERLATALSQWKVRNALVEVNSIGGPNFEELLRTGVNVMPFQTTAQTKGPLILSLALTFEKSEMKFLDVPIATRELEAYEANRSEVTGRITYNAPSGFHDDTVIARALMNEMRSRGSGIYI